MSVWVEIRANRIIYTNSPVTLHVSVWVEIICQEIHSKSTVSRSTWACELKSFPLFQPRVHTLSRSTWACELKWPIYNTIPNNGLVTLHVSVWVEIVFPSQSLVPLPSRSTWACELKCTVSRFASFFCIVTLHVSVWVEIWSTRLLLRLLKSRSTWACELKWYT